MSGGELGSRVCATLRNFLSHGVARGLVYNRSQKVSNGFQEGLAQQLTHRTPQIWWSHMHHPHTHGTAGNGCRLHPISELRRSVRTRISAARAAYLAQYLASQGHIAPLCKPKNGG